LVEKEKKFHGTVILMSWWKKWNEEENVCWKKGKNEEKVREKTSSNHELVKTKWKFTALYS
jgi:23S rRNA maturation mini-RNase III